MIRTERKKDSYSPPQNARLKASYCYIRLVCVLVNIALNNEFHLRSLRWNIVPIIYSSSSMGPLIMWIYIKPKYRYFYYKIMGPNIILIPQSIFWFKCIILLSKLRQKSIKVKRICSKSGHVWSLMLKIRKVRSMTSPIRGPTKLRSSCNPFTGGS